MGESLTNNKYNKNIKLDLKPIKQQARLFKIQNILLFLRQF